MVRSFLWKTGWVAIGLSLSWACSRPNPAFGGDEEPVAGATTAADDGNSGPEPPVGGDSTGAGAGSQSTTASTADGTTSDDGDSSDGQVPDPEDTGEFGEPASILFVNFDGVTLEFGLDDATTNTSEIASRFDGVPLAPFGEGPKRAEVMERLAEIWAPFNVELTEFRPVTGEYGMIVVTPSNPFGETTLGVASQDCGNENPNSVGFTFSSANDQISADVVALAISHSAGRGYGLESVEGEDLMAGMPIPGIMFTEPCLPLSVQPLCPQHEKFCPQGQQSSAIELEDALP